MLFRSDDGGADHKGTRAGLPRDAWPVFWIHGPLIKKAARIADGPFVEDQEEAYRPIINFCTLLPALLLARTM